MSFLRLLERDDGSRILLLIDDEQQCFELQIPPQLMGAQLGRYDLDGHYLGEDQVDVA